MRQNINDNADRQISDHAHREINDNAHQDTSENTSQTTSQPTSRNTSDNTGYNPSNNTHQTLTKENTRRISALLKRARENAERQLKATQLAPALQTVRNEVWPLAEELREADPRAFDAHRDALAVLLNDCALAVVDEVPRPVLPSFDTPRVRRFDVRDVDALLDAGRPGERPVIGQLFGQALAVVRDPVLREVITANQQGVRILQRANRWIRMLTDAV
ncbi:hypothetical protein [Streptomyces sp. NPDC003077]|uniref:hypothetical protein n=1 Tax=Streptomyces sp. NPDC003077 TaxID=3154443 RepID=UPI0033B8A915